MADGEKKRFGNFAEYAKARQAGKVGSSDTFQISSQDQVTGMSGQGGADQSRFMQSFPASQAGQMSGVLQQQLQQQQLQQQGLQQSLQQGLQQQQRGLGPPGMPGMMGGPARQLPPHHAAGGVGGGLARPPGGGGAIGGQGYNPSGELLAMLGKGGAGGVNGAVGATGGHAAAVQRPFGYEESADFPSLGRSSQSEGGGLSAQSDRSLEDEFPALPGSMGGQGPANNSLVSSGSGGPGMAEQFQRMRLDPARSTPAARDKPDRFGMLGLLNVIRMVDENLNMLALGTDLTHLGLDLNATGNLWETFESPWADPRAARTPDYTVPQCYLIPPPPLKTVFFTKFKDATLFYIFYYFLASRAPHQDLRKTLVECASKELVNRGWEYRVLGGPDSSVWMIRVPGTNEVRYFDHHTMEARPLPVTPPPPPPGGLQPAAGQAPEH